MPFTKTEQPPARVVAITDPTVCRVCFTTASAPATVVLQFDDGSAVERQVQLSRLNATQRNNLDALLLALRRAAAQDHGMTET